MYTRELADVLKTGGIAVLATDTLYGIVASALQKNAVEKIYTIKARDLDKPYIILLSSAVELKNFGITPTSEQSVYLNSVWPGKVSVILPLPTSTSTLYQYLHRGKKALAFRVPAKSELRELLKQTGPLVAPSANTQGGEPAITVDEAKSYFGDLVDMYVDEGLIEGSPSRLVDLTGIEPKILRN